MDTTEIRMTNLFLQLGLSAEEADIASFIEQHQLAEDIALTDAPFWSEGQRQFLRETLDKDNPWAMIVDALNESLHEDAVAARTGH